MNSPYENPSVARELGHIMRMRRQGSVDGGEAAELARITRALASPAQRAAFETRIAEELRADEPSTLEEEGPNGPRTLFRYNIHRPESVRVARDWLIASYARGEVSQTTYENYRPLLDDVLANPWK